MKTYKKIIETKFHKKIPFYFIEGEKLVIFYSPKSQEFIPPFRIKEEYCTRRGMSGCRDYKTQFEHTHFTMSGYVQGEIFLFYKEELSLPEENSWEEINSQELLYALTVKYPFKLTPFLMEEGVELPEEIRTIVRPVINIYYRMNSYSLTSHIKIDDESKSFKMNIKINEEKVFTLPKISEKKIWFKDENTTIILNEDRYPRWEIYYTEFLGRETLYVKDEKKEKLFGWEVYKDTSHPRCEIDFQKLQKILIFPVDELLYSRVGDVMFLTKSDFYSENYNENEYKKFSTIEEFNELKTNSNLYQLDKIQIQEIGDKFILYHPEHGYLFLDKGQEYYIVPVPYISRGHD